MAQHIECAEKIQELLNQYNCKFEVINQVTIVAKDEDIQEEETVVAPEAIVEEEPKVEVTEETQPEAEVIAEEAPETVAEEPAIL